MNSTTQSELVLVGHLLALIGDIEWHQRERGLVLVAMGQHHVDEAKKYIEKLTGVPAADLVARSESSGGRTQVIGVGEAPLPAQTFVRWTPEEEARLVEAFDQGKTSAELARIHNRSRAGIEARLLKLGKIDVASLTIQLRYDPARRTIVDKSEGS